MCAVIWLVTRDKNYERWESSKTTVEIVDRIPVFMDFLPELPLPPARNSPRATATLPPPPPLPRWFLPPSSLQKDDAPQPCILVIFAWTPLSGSLWRQLRLPPGSQELPRPEFSRRSRYFPIPPSRTSRVSLSADSFYQLATKWFRFCELWI